jgi:hypothetical protein
MSAFSPLPDGNKASKKLEFVTQREAAALLRLSARTIRRYLHDPQTREILGAVYDRGRWRIPRSSFKPPWRIAEIRERLTKIGKGDDDSFSSRFRHESGIGNLRLEREAKILRQALEIERRSQKRRLTKRAKCEIEEVWKVARMVAAKYRRSAFDAPKLYEKWLIAQNNREKQRNAPQIKWLKRHGLWASAKALMTSGDDHFEYSENGQIRKAFFPKGEAHFEAVIGGQDQADRTKRVNFLIPHSFLENLEREGKTVRITCVKLHSINLYPVETKAQIARKVREFQKSWPSPKFIAVATKRYNESRWQLDLEGAAVKCRREKKPITPENLWKRMYRDEIAQWQGRPGISRSSYFRRHYSKHDLVRVRRLRIAFDAQHITNRKSGGVRDGFALGDDDLKGMTLQTAEGWELANPCRDESEK